MIIYVDKNSHCHITNPNGEYTSVETDFFDGKCDSFIEGFCYEIKENGYAIYAWKPYDELDNVQREYEKQLLKESQTELFELKSQKEDLLESYVTGVNSI